MSVPLLCLPVRSYSHAQSASAVGTFLPLVVFWIGGVADVGTASSKEGGRGLRIAKVTAAWLLGLLGFGATFSLQALFSS
jgi:hypothetical protein